MRRIIIPLLIAVLVTLTIGTGTGAAAAVITEGESKPSQGTSLASPDALMLDTEDYREAAMAFLADRFGVDNEDVAIEGSTVEKLAYVQRTFWWGKYIIKGSENDGYGGVYVDVETREVLLKGDFDALNEDNRQQEEELRQEAGKIELGLYLELQGLAPEGDVRVSIIPAYSPSEEIQEELARLREEYSDVAEFIGEDGSLIRREGLTDQNRVRVAEYREKARQIRLGAYQETTAELVQFLEGLAKDFEVDEGYINPRIEAVLGRTDIETLAQVEFVGSIHKEMLFTALDISVSSDDVAVIGDQNNEEPVDAVEEPVGIEPPTESARSNQAASPLQQVLDSIKAGIMGLVALLKGLLAG